MLTDLTSSSYILWSPYFNNSLKSNPKPNSQGLSLLKNSPISSGLFRFNTFVTIQQQLFLLPNESAYLLNLSTSEEDARYKQVLKMRPFIEHEK